MEKYPEEPKDIFKQRRRTPHSGATGRTRSESLRNPKNMGFLEVILSLMRLRHEESKITHILSGLNRPHKHLVGHND